MFDYEAEVLGLDNTKKEKPSIENCYFYYGKYFSLGFQPIVLHPYTKVPVQKNWNKKRGWEKPELEEFNIGWLLGIQIELVNNRKGYLVCLDFDDLKVYREFQEKNPDLADTLVQKSGGKHKGYHLFYLSSHPLPSKKFNGFELLAEGKQVVVFPSVVERRYEFEIYGDFDLCLVTQIKKVDGEKFLKLLNIFSKQFEEKNNEKENWITEEEDKEENKNIFKEDIKSNGFFLAYRDKKENRKDIERIDKDIKDKREEKIRKFSRKRVYHFVDKVTKVDWRFLRFRRPRSYLNALIPFSDWVRVVGDVELKKGFLCPMHSEVHPSVAVYGGKYGGYVICDFHERAGRKFYFFLDMLASIVDGHEEVLSLSEAVEYYKRWVKEKGVDFSKVEVVKGYVKQVDRLKYRLKRYLYLLSPVERRVFSYILRILKHQAVKYGLLWDFSMPLKMVAQRLKISQGAVCRAFRLFERIGLVRRKWRKGKSAIFRVNFNLSSVEFYERVLREKKTKPEDVLDTTKPLKIEMIFEDPQDPEKEKEHLIYRADYLAFEILRSPPRAS